jgi:hypothetical protein
MDETFSKSCKYALLVTILAASVVAIAANNSFALAQPCQAQLGPPNASTQQYYYGGNFQVTLPVSATCSFYSGQLYATGTAYDTTYNVNIGAANTALSSTYGGYSYAGQLTFTLPTSAQSHLVQFSVSVYSAQTGYFGGSLLATTSSTFVVGPSYYQSYPAYPTYPTQSCPSYPSYPYYPSNPSYPYSPGWGYYSNCNYYYYRSGGYYNNNHYYCSPGRNRCVPPPRH